MYRNNQEEARGSMHVWGSGVPRWAVASRRSRGERGLSMPHPERNQRHHSEAVKKRNANRPTRRTSQYITDSVNFFFPFPPSPPIRFISFYRAVDAPSPPEATEPASSPPPPPAAAAAAAAAAAECLLFFRPLEDAPPQREAFLSFAMASFHTSMCRVLQARAQ
jgi:hypothetical protein